MILAVAWLGAVGFITVGLDGTVGDEWWREMPPSLCIFCGSRGAADAILNVVLFVPLGLLTSHRRGIAFAVVAGLILSGIIEIWQFRLPGRSSTVGDLIWNTTGAGLGAMLGSVVRRWLPPARSMSDGPPLAARALTFFLPAIFLSSAGWLAHPVGTDARYFGQWTQDLGFMEHYQGRLLSAELDDAPVPWGPFPVGASRPDFGNDFSLRLAVEKGPSPRAIAPILSIYDARRQEILVFGADGEDLIWRLRDRAQAAGFDYRELRVRNALGTVAVGDTVRLAATRVGDELCLAVDGARQCGLGFRPEETWRYLMNLEGASPKLQRVLEIGWMAALFSPVGLLGGGPRSILVLGGLSTSLVLAAVAATPLIFPQWPGWLGLALGIALGIALRPLVRLVVGVPNQSGPPG